MRGQSQTAAHTPAHLVDAPPKALPAKKRLDGCALCPGGGAPRPRPRLALDGGA
jgi:hypothetical protein